MEGRLVGYSNSSKSYRIYNTATRGIVEGKNVINIETPSYLRSLPAEETPPQRLWSQVDGHNYITDDKFLHDVRNLTSVLHSSLGAPADHITAGGLSTNPQDAELLDGINDIARRDVLQGGGSGLLQKGVPSGGSY